MKTDLSQLMTILGYDFQDQNYLERALTHRSVSAENNERLEFLGDSIVNFIIAKVLCDELPDAPEGMLTRQRANLVNRETLSEVAIELSLGDYLRLGPGELKSGGHRRSSILSDAMEAVIAAIYLDSDMKTVQECVQRWYQPRIKQAKSGKIKKDAKTALQEQLQARKYSLPDYTVLTIGGTAHAQEFIVECKVDGIKHTATGKGSSRQRAEQIAAEGLLKQLGWKL